MDKLGTEPSVGLKPSSNISEMISKFSKACKFRSIGVLNSSENLNHGGERQKLLHDNAPSLADERSSSSTDDPEFDAVKIHPQPTEVQKEVIQCGHMEILKLFDTLLALKLAYIKLQEAHIPYDPDKIGASDEEVVSQLESLCKIKKAYKEKLMKEIHSGSVCSALLFAETKVYKRELEKLKVEAENKDHRVVNLKRELRELEMWNKKLADQIRDRAKESIVGLSYCSFEEVVKTVAKAIHDFAKPLIVLLKVSDWDLDQAANVIQNSVVYAKRSHKKYAFEAFVARRMFHGFSSQCSNMENIMKFDDAFDALTENPQSGFAKFCRNRYLSVVHPRVEASFFGNLDHRTLLVNGIHPRTRFYQAFVKMARWVWFLQGFSAFADPKAEMFGVKQGSEFSDVYMEVPEELNECKALLDKSGERLKVEFMIIPGFRRGDTLIRSQVYVSKMGSSNETQNL